MKILGIIAIVLTWAFATLLIWGMFYQSESRDLITIMVCSIASALSTICCVFMAIIVLKR